MKGLWIEDTKLKVRDDLPVPNVAQGEALIQVLVTGICGTDLQLLQSYYSYTGIPGHEFVGRVVQASSDTSLIGKRVVGEINISCGHCDACLRGDKNHCEQRSVLGIKNKNGAFAEYISLPIENLIVVPDAVSNETAVFIEPLAAALEIQQQIQLKSTDKILVIGAGRLGQIIVQSLLSTQNKIFVVARYKNQQCMLKHKNITLIDEEEISPHSMDVVIEAAGSATAFTSACNAVRPRGTIVLKSTYASGETIAFNASQIVVNEITIIGSRCGPFQKALDYLASGDVQPENLIQGQYVLNDAIQAFEQAAQPGIIKVLISPSDD